MSGVGSGGGRTPLGITEMQPDEVVEMNRDRLSAWILIGGAILALLAVLSLGTVLTAVIIVTPAAGMLAAGVWIRFKLRTPRLHS